MWLSCDDGTELATFTKLVKGCAPVPAAANSAIS